MNQKRGTGATFFRAILSIFLVGISLISAGVSSDFVFAKEGAAESERPIIPEARAMVLELLVPTKMVKDVEVLKTMMRTDRSLFVPKDLRDYAFFDITLPIGSGQTISPPLVVAWMTETLQPKATDKVLEIGTGSGYQAAILSPLVAEVYSIEIVPTLGKKAAETLKKLGYVNVRVKVGDGYQGWPEAAPFDKIIVTCSPEKIPQPLVDQLVDGGMILIPVGERYHQYFYRCVKRGAELEKTELIPAFFVPMTGEAENGRVVQPDPANPSIRGGDFEKAADGGAPEGWYYTRNVQVKKDLTAPQGESVLVFDNLAVHREHRKKDALERIRLRKEEEKRRPADEDTPNKDASSENDGSGMDGNGNGKETADAQDDFIDAEIDPLTARQRAGELTAHTLQGFPVDGRKVKKLRVSAQMEGISLSSTEGRRTITVATIGFFDENRESLGDQILFALRPGDSDWREYRADEISVPRKAREGSIRIGILDGIGVLKIDQLVLEKE